MMENKRFRLLLSSLVALIAIQMQAEAQLPRLVVCITVDQLRSDYLRALEPIMGEEGFKKMLNTGQVYERVQFPFEPINAISATGSIFSGSYPEAHGLESEELYLRQIGKHVKLFHDENYLGNYTRDQFSPASLVVTTLGDRLKEASSGEALVYSIAPRAQQAIASAGILADGAYWLDERIGSWATTNYYPQMLPALEQYNRSEAGPNKRLISGLQWKPLKKYSRPSISYSDWGRSFSYRYQSKDAASYRESGIVNEEITNFALKLLESAGYKERQTPGLLSLSYSLKPQHHAELAAEDVDAYVRLDLELQRLFKALDKQFGLPNCLISLSGTGYTSYQDYQDSKRERLKRKINIARLTALSNMYLTALHGPGEWISANKNGRLYLNHKAIESKKLDLHRVQSQVAEFLRSSEGLATATPAHELASSSREAVNMIARGVSPRYQADVYWTVLPSFQIEDLKEHSELEHKSKLISSPLLIMGTGIRPSKEPLPEIDVRDIVRIICSTLRIRPPNS